VPLHTTHSPEALRASAPVHERDHRVQLEVGDEIATRLRALGLNELHPRREIRLRANAMIARARELRRALRRQRLEAPRSTLNLVRKDDESDSA
jgi:hypothetical protein